MFKSLMVFAFCSILCLAETTVDINGGFERCSANSNGILTPVGWYLDKKISKNGEVRATTAKEEVCNGNFSINLESEEDGVIYFARLMDHFPVNAGDKIRFRVFVKGQGKFRILLLMMKGPGLDYMIRTIGGFPEKNIADEENWTELKHEMKMISVPATKSKETFSKLWFLPMIYVHGEADLYMDDLSIEVIPSEEK